MANWPPYQIYDDLEKFIFSLGIRFIGEVNSEILAKEFKNVKNFMELDIRVGKIISAEEFPEINKPSYLLNIDFGEDIGIKKTSAQITNYSLESLVNRKCIGIINLGEKQIGSIMSQCLILGSIDKEGRVTLVHPSQDSENGLSVA